MHRLQIGASGAFYLFIFFYRASGAFIFFIALRAFIAPPAHFIFFIAFIAPPAHFIFFIRAPHRLQIGAGRLSASQSTTSAK